MTGWPECYHWVIPLVCISVKLNRISVHSPLWYVMKAQFSSKFLKSGWFSCQLWNNNWELSIHLNVTQKINLFKYICKRFVTIIPRQWHTGFIKDTLILLLFGHTFVVFSCNNWVKLVGKITNRKLQNFTNTDKASQIEMQIDLHLQLELKVFGQ